MKSLLGGFGEGDHERIAWEVNGRAYTYGECLVEIGIRKTWIRAHGLQGIQALHGFPPFELWLWTLAAWEEGLCVAPLSSRFPLSQYQLSLDQLPKHGILRPESRSAEPADEATDPSVQLIIFSSGSTGLPKALGHSLEGLIASAEATSDFYQFHVGDRWLLSLDLSHIGGLQIALRCWMRKAVCVYAGEPKDVGSALANGNADIDFVSLVPTQLHRALNEPEQLLALKKCSAILVGGAATHEDLLRKAEAAGLPVSITYGCTEAASQIAAFNPGNYPKRPRCVGEVLPHWEIVEAYNRLWLRGPALFLGHWQEGQWFPCSAFALPDNGFLNGRWLTIEGRGDQVFQVGAENLAPQEILEPLRSHGLIEDAVVLSKDDPDFGKLPLLVIRGPKAPSIPAIQSVFEKNLVPVKRPREIWWHASSDVSKPSKALYEQWVFHPKGDRGDIRLLWTYGQKNDKPGL